MRAAGCSAGSRRRAPAAAPASVRRRQVEVRRRRLRRRARRVCTRAAAARLARARRCGRRAGAAGTFSTVVAARAMRGGVGRGAGAGAGAGVRPAPARATRRPAAAAAAGGTARSTSCAATRCSISTPRRSAPSTARPPSAPAAGSRRRRPAMPRAPAASVALCGSRKVEGERAVSRWFEPSRAGSRRCSARGPWGCHGLREREAAHNATRKSKRCSSADFARCNELSSSPPRAAGAVQLFTSSCGAAQLAGSSLRAAAPQNDVAHHPPPRPPRRALARFGVPRQEVRELVQVRAQGEPQPRRARLRCAVERVKPYTGLHLNTLPTHTRSPYTCPVGTQVE